MADKKSFKDYSFKELLFELALYSKLPILLKEYQSSTYKEYDDEFGDTRTIYKDGFSEDLEHLIDFMKTDTNIIYYCPICKTSLSLHPHLNSVNKDLASLSIFEAPEYMLEDEEFNPPLLDFEMSKIITDKLIPNYGIFKKQVTCTHCKNVFTFIYKLNMKMSNSILVESLSLEKIGQTPSINDFSDASNEYKKVLDTKYVKELNKALGLKSHGVGIGSFVYLRRIFEKLIFEIVNEKVVNDSSFNLEEFKGFHMDEKINSLKNDLPQNLVDNSKILYGILSKGIHQLEENECLLYFDIVYLAIKNILDEKVRIKKQRENEKKVKEELQKINSLLK
ncbi:hypothetical protein [Clostridium sp. JS66]|uniref:hypothetical protein n=1 Tax=Clostridium sp. JS66 TaxID=3064705 RepID=UPI00298DB9D7|nr:hypothetical protein [Clostridium sp. JS66]WPC42368.1 hypothetical protein Q6H37_02580 [Clostridium sp. JS66]